MALQKDKVKVFGKRVLVEKERIDAGGLKLTPALEEDGQKNTGKIVGVGQVGFLNKLRGIELGKTVWFRKFFIANAESENALVFVNVDDIMAVS